MRLLLGIFLLVAAFAWGFYNYNHHRSEGVPHKQALYRGLTCGVNSLISGVFIIRMLTFQADSNPSEGINIVSNVPSDHVEPSTVNFTVNTELPEHNFNIPWVLLLAGVGTALVAPELLPFVFVGW
ncbi:hypothetical protein A6770_38090 [Nostoc minutum NIES-26]|uniref:Transmembrane protein n=1 Tax=Nostoc minutum NIES-26 TaxID=1844469 RepID=A0A367RY61_9NOSO|nr:hypothetical protein A6770_38090 [Nostoc minutum NIES-26]